MVLGQFQRDNMVSPTLGNPTRIAVRDASSSSQSYPTDSEGNVVCPPQSQLSCPVCPDDQECYLKGPTATSCSEYYCGAKQLDGSSPVPIGSIVGGVIGGVCGLAVVIGILYYFLIYKKRSVVLDDSDDMMMSTVEPDESVYAISNNMESHIGDPNLSPLPDQNTEKPVLRPPNLRAKRINSYDSFTKPTKAKTAKEIAAMQRRERQKRIARKANLNLQGVVTDPANPRHSVATSVSTSNASNILPIAYIPGVTVWPTKNNTRSLFSADSDSVFSDLNTIENASIVGDVQRANGGNPAYIASSQNATTTAIKAQPKLVNVDKIEEESEGGDEFENTTDNSELDVSSRASSVHSAHGNDIQLATMNEEESEDSDVDSDIENITRATSLRKPKANDKFVDSQQTSSLQSSNTKDSKTLQASLLTSPEEVSIDEEEKTKTGNSFVGDGSFVLDVEMDTSSKQSDDDPFAEK